jgi:hypothetical protein
VKFKRIVRRHAPLAGDKIGVHSFEVEEAGEARPTGGGEPLALFVVKA